AYVSQAAYLWRFGYRPIAPDITPLYLFGSTLNETRYISSSALGVFSLVTGPGDPQTSANLLQAVGLYSFAGACLAFGLVQRLPRWALTSYAAVAVLSGWSLNIVWANNYDNLVALGWFLALVVIAADDRLLDVPGVVLWTLFAVAVLYTYPELAGIVLGA